MNNPHVREPDPSLTLVLRGIDELMHPRDVIGTVTRLLEHTRSSVNAASAGLVIRRLGRDDLELLATTNHTAAELEFYQLQTRQGPCIDSAHTGKPVSATGIEDIRRQWPGLAEQFTNAGYRAVRATPLSWEPDVIGALNLFWQQPHRSTAAEMTQLQIFAHLTTLALITDGQIPPTTLLQRTRLALAERTLIEQAKGVLAQQHNIPIDQAFTVLSDRAAQEKIPISQLAEAVINDAGQAKAPTG